MGVAEKRRAREKAAERAATAAAVAEAEEEEAARIEAKRQRKAAKRAAAELAAAEDVSAVEAADVKRQRKAVEEGLTEEEAAEAKRERKAARRAAKEAAATLELEGEAAIETKGKAQQPDSGNKDSSDVVPDGLTVFVGGIDFRCEEATLRADFLVCGEIEHMTMPLSKDGRSSGSAFITFKTREGVAKALEYDDDDYGGRRLMVKVAGKIGERGHARGSADLEVCVKGLRNQDTDDDVRKAFADCGQITSLRLPRWPDGGAKGMAFITFENEDGFFKAFQKDGMEWGNWQLTVKKAVQGSGGGKGNVAASPSKGSGKDSKGKSNGKGKKGK